MKSIVLAQLWYLDLGHEIGRGVIDYASTKKDWRLTKLGLDTVREHLSDWTFEALILPGLFDSPHWEPLFKKRMLVVSTHYVPSINKVPQVDLDHFATGAMAARYFLDKGYKHFLGVNKQPQAAHELRLEGFLSTLRKRRMKPVALHHDEPHLDCQITQWLQATPKPAAVFCSTDRIAREVVEMALQAGFSVPDDIAVLGCEDETSVCLCSPVQLSSIHLPYYKVGYEAARLMDRLLSGAKDGCCNVLLPPDYVNERASTATPGRTAPPRRSGKHDAH